MDEQAGFGAHEAPHADLREWLARAEALGEVKTIRGAHWDQELGAIAAMIYRHDPENPPALLFDEIAGYPAGFRVLSGMTNSPGRLALTLGLPRPGHPMELVRAYRDRMKDFQPIGPAVANDGPVLENMDEGADVDVLKFPVPFLHEGDGGRYIGTGNLVITRDPDDGWVNVGTYRVMVHDRNTVALAMGSAKHGRIMMEKYHSKGEPCPVLVSVGQDPLLFLSGGNEVDHGLPEFAHAGGHRGRPFEVIEAALTGLPMPAAAEIVLEGEVLPGETRAEGPFGEWTGYYGGGVTERPIIRVERVYYRSDPILTMARPGRPPADYTYSKCVMKSAMLWDQVERAGLPGVAGVWSHMSGGGRMFNVIAIRQAYAGHAKQALLLAGGALAGHFIGRYVVVVDDDIDPTNLFDVNWAMASRCDPAEDIDIVRRAMTGPLDPLKLPGGDNLNSRALIDACRPFEWIDDFPAVAESSPELRARTLKKWGHLMS